MPDSVVWSLECTLLPRVPTLCFQDLLVHLNSGWWCRFLHLFVYWQFVVDSALRLLLYFSVLCFLFYIYIYFLVWFGFVGQDVLKRYFRPVYEIFMVG